MKILLIGNYPPPVCGWAMHTKLVADELRRRGHRCDVLKLNENRTVKNPAYIDVQNAGDYVRKLVGHSVAGFRFNVDVNAKSKKGYILALTALLIARLFNRYVTLTFRGGVSQRYFPRNGNRGAFWAFRLLFSAARAIACDNEEIKRAIASYGIRPEKVSAIAPFSPQYVEYAKAELPERISKFLDACTPAWFSYLCFRDEYDLPSLRACVAQYRKRYPRAGFVWAGFPEKELAQVQQYLNSWEEDDRSAVLLCGNMPHDVFLTVMKRCFGCIRTPLSDGVAASVLESLALDVPVVASENGHRPAGVVTYSGRPGDMCAQLHYVTEHYNELKRARNRDSAKDTIAQTADWLTLERKSSVLSKAARAR